jgi:rubrerythrin
MSIQLKPSELFKAATLLEQKGENFYRKAAGNSAGECQQLLLQLAEMEKVHAKIFSNFANEANFENEILSAEEKAEELSFLDALTNDRIITEELAVSGEDKLETIFLKAMQLEKNSVFFYSAIKEILTQKMSREAVDKLIAEEVKHFRMLNAALNKLKSAGKL